MGSLANLKPLRIAQYTRYHWREGIVETLVNLVAQQTLVREHVNLAAAFQRIPSAGQIVRAGPSQEL